MKVISALRERSAVNTVMFMIPLVIISRAFPLFSFVYYLLLFFLILVFIQAYEFILKDRFLLRLLLLFVAFGLWSAATSLWSDYPLITLMRTAYFIFISVGGVLAGYLWFKINPGSLDLFFPANIVVLALCLFSLVTNIPADSWTGGNGKGFMGFAGHQNTLSSVILFTLPGLVWQRAKGRGQSEIRNPKSKIRNPLVDILLLANLTILVLTYSRASMLSLICGAIIFLILAKKWHTILYSAVVVLLISGIIYFSPTLKEKAVKLIEKDFPTFYSSREWLWVPSYKAALNGGLTGLGYGISDPVIKADVPGSHYEGERYVREKGNSILALIEEVGIVGLVLFILPLVYLFYNYKNIHNQQPTTNNQPASRNQYPVLAILLAAFTAFIIHSQFEAWWVGVGSTELPLFFLYMGILMTTNN